MFALSLSFLFTFLFILILVIIFVMKRAPRAPPELTKAGIEFSRRAARTQHTEGAVRLLWGCVITLFCICDRDFALQGVSRAENRTGKLARPACKTRVLA